MRGLMVSSSVAGALALLAAPAAPAAITEIIDASGDGVSSLSGSEGVAVDGTGNVYVAGASTDNVFKITPAGVITEIIDASGAGAGNVLDAPFDIAVDSAGNVYVAGSGSDNVFKVTPGGVITEIIDATGDGAVPLLTPFGIAVDEASGDVYVAGRDSWNCFRITPLGVITEIIDFTGDGTNALQEADAVAVDGAGNVYVTGRMSDNAFKITPGGTITQIIDSSGDGVNGLDCGTFNTCGCAAATDGTVYITAGASDNAFRITSGGAITRILDASGDGAGNAVNLPQGVAVDDSTGNVYVSCALSDNAFEITTGGTVTEIIDASGDGAGNTLDAPDVAAIATNGAGKIYVSAYFTNNAFEIEPGVVPPPVAVVTEIIDGAGDGISPLVNPDGIDVDPAGNVYVGGCGNSPGNSSVFKITPDDMITEILDGTGGGIAPFNCPVGIALDSHGNVFVAGHRSDNVFRIASDGTIALVMDASDGILAPFDIDIDADDNVYVTGFGSDNAFRITPGGAITEIIDASGDGVHALDMPFGIALDADGNAYIAGNEENIVFKVTPGLGPGSITTIIDATGDGTNALSKVADVAVDDLGNVYVTGNGSDNVFRVSSSGAITQVLDISSGVDNPTGVVTDAAGNVYVAAFSSDNVTRLTPQGAITEVLGPAGDGMNGFDGPADDCLAVDRMGNVYAAGTLSFHNVFRIEVEAPRLMLARSGGSGAVQPGQTVTIELHMSDLAGFEAAGFEAYLAYDPAALQFDGAAYTPAPFGLPGVTGGAINPAPGEIVLGAGLGGGQMPTTGDALLATVTFTAAGVVECAGTDVRFRAHDPATRITDVLDDASDLILADTAPVVIDGEGPAITGCPSNITVPAEAGAATAVVSWTDPVAVDSCDGPVALVCVPPSGSVFAVGTTPVLCTAIDAQGNANFCMFDVTVTPTNAVVVDIELAGVFTPVTRCIRFETDDCGHGANVELDFIDHDASGATPVRYAGTIEVGAGAWTTLCAKDEQHTQWASATLSIAGTQYVADAAIGLAPGDTDNDGDVDIHDVTLFIAQFGGPGPAPACPWAGARGADFDNDGMVSSPDYTLLTAQWLTTSACSCTMLLAADARTSVTTAELAPWIAARADLDANGVVDARDVARFEKRHALPAALSEAMQRGR